MNQPLLERRPILFERGNEPTKRVLYLFSPRTEAGTWEVYRLRKGKELPDDWSDWTW